MSTSLVFPFDSTGLSPKNLVENELRVVLPPAGIKDQSFIVPNAAAFFASSLVIKDSPNTTGRVLREHVDYELSHYSVAASLATGKPCYGSITFIDRYYTGNVYLTYRSVGGDFSRFDHTWVEQQTKERYAMRHITFDQIVGVPSEFPTDIHTHKPEDMVGLSEVATGLSAIAAAIREANRADVTTYIAQLGNHLNSAGAHSPSQVGLGNLFNYKVATSADIDSQKYDRYVTAGVLSAWVTGKLTALAETIPVVNLTNYYTKSEANDQFIDANEFAQLTYTKTQIDDKIRQALSGSSVDLTGYAKTTDLLPYAKTTAVQTMINDAFNGATVDLTGYAKTTDLAPFAKKTDLESYAKTTDLTAYAKTTELASYARTEDLTAYAKKTDLAAYPKTTEVETSISNALSAYVPTFTIVNKTGSYTVAVGDLNGKTIIRCGNTSGTATITLPQTTTAVAVGTQIHIRRVGTGEVTVAPASGVTIIPNDSLVLRRVGITATFIKIDNTTWDCITELV